MKQREAKTFNINELVHKKAPDFRFVYSNNSGLGANFYDVNLVFGEIQSSFSADAPYIEDKVAITLTWEHLKALSIALQQAIADFEKTAIIRARPDEREV
ncbi:MAG: hypothetical protein ACLQU1_08355 [Bryobacteraceae bacterium]